ncbi:MAG: SurA N-terminal domain-containing protein [Elusimicrobia bacterium]|nr:SurA N-terminal domain-containing protein [Elusimicrobiota bacterium]
MISFLNRYRRPLFIATVAVFLIGTFVGLGGYLFTSNDMTEAVASVGSVKIPYQGYRSRVDQYVDALRNRNGEVSDEAVKEIKVNILRDMIVDEMLLVKAADMGITVTDSELAHDIRSTPAFQAGGEFSPESYFRVVRGVFRDTPQGYETMRRRSLIASRLKQVVFQAAKLTPGELDAAYAKDRAAAETDFQKAWAQRGKYPEAAKLTAAEFKRRYAEQRKQSVAGQAQQVRALELINYFLRQVSSQVEVKSFLEQRESGT